MLQALVEHYSGAGQPEVVERAVLHMDVASLDLNQVQHTSCLLVGCMPHDASVKPTSCLLVATDHIKHLVWTSQSDKHIQRDQNRMILYSHADR